MTNQETDPSPGDRNPQGNQSTSENSLRTDSCRIRLYFWFLLAGWTLVVAGSLSWNLHQQNQQILDMARNSARINYEKDTLYRRWATVLGGVYVQVTPETPPNVYLSHIPERDLTTPSGRHLTLVNPAYMTRQVYAMALERSEIRGHLTSLNPINPVNAPDPWESEALKSFDAGNRESYGIVAMDGKSYFRLMRPFKVEKGCLKCHATQGYKEGDIRGGVSVSIPMAPLWAAAQRTFFSLLLGHGLLWLLGAAGLTVASLRLQSALSKQEEAERAMHQANEQLQVMVLDYKGRNREISLTNDLADQLQSCLSLEKAHEVITRFLPRLFPDLSGELLMLNASLNLLELVLSWGGHPPEATIKDPMTCLALRRGRSYLLLDPKLDLICDNLSKPLTTGYLCIPMMAQGEALGIFQIRGDAGDPDVLSESTRRLAHAIAELLAMALANLKLRDTLRHQAIRDPLTGLFNRRFLEETMEREIHLARRQGSALGVIMMDLDHFKQFNDTLGHSAGDALLSALGRLIKENVRKEDVACRYGGEEFSLILPGATQEATCQRAEEIRRLVQELHLQHQGQSLGEVTISLGVATFPNHGDTIESLLQAADAALYRAKSEGRNRVVLADGGLEEDRQDPAGRGAATG